MKVIRVLARIAMIAAAAGVFMGLTALDARSIRPPEFRIRPRIFGREHRPAEPRLSGVPGFAGKSFLFAMITVGGRKLLRLRLADRSPI